MKIFLGLIIFIIVFVAYVRFMEATSIFYPSRLMVHSPRMVNLPFEDVYFETSDHVKLNGWLVKAPPATATILFLHGNAGNMSDRLDKILLFYKMGLNVFIVDYRGYGNSDGHPTEKGMYRDAQAAWDYLKTRQDIDTGKIIGYGESLGGSGVVDLAVHRPLAALILDSSFSSAADMAQKILPVVPSFILSVKLDSVGKIKNISAPKLIIHSPDDEMIPYAQSQKLLEAAPEPKEFLKITGTHNDGYTMARDVYVSGIYSFLKKWNLVK